MKNGIFILILVGLFVFNCNEEVKETTKGAEALKQEIVPGNFAHTVYFWLKNPENAQDRAAFEKSLKTFINQSPYITTKHIGIPAATNREVIDNTYTYSLLLTFKDKAEQDKYQDEAGHKQFIEESSYLWSKVIVYDSENLLLD